jgi:hypothetical protein
VTTSEILYTYVPPNHPALTEGHWFFDTGQWCHCASMAQCSDGRWAVSIDLIPHWQSSDKVEDTFPTKEAAIEFIGKFFRQPVRTVLPNEFPDYEEL